MSCGMCTALGSADVCHMHMAIVSWHYCGWRRHFHAPLALAAYNRRLRIPAQADKTSTALLLNFSRLLRGGRGGCTPVPRGACPAAPGYPRPRPPGIGPRSAGGDGLAGCAARCPRRSRCNRALARFVSTHQEKCCFSSDPRRSI